MKLKLNVEIQMFIAKLSLVCQAYSVNIVKIDAFRSIYCTEY